MSIRIAVIGGGPGGYVAAIRAAQLGADVTIIEKDALGGTCLNRGCIPTKSLLHSASTLAVVRDASKFGVSASGVSLDFSAVMKRKEDVVAQLRNGVASLMRKNRIRVVGGTATLVDARTLALVGKVDQMRVDGIIIATGAMADTAAIDGIDEPGVITSDAALSWEQLPKSIAVIGGGVIGVELAQVMHGLGAQVTILEAMPHILPAEDDDIASVLDDALRSAGIVVFTNVSVRSIRSVKRGKRISFKIGDSSEERTCLAESVVVCVGRRPYTDDLGVNRLNLRRDGDGLAVNERMATNVPGIYAVGDVIGRTMLAHVAMAEGICAAENIMGTAACMDYRTVPRCVYTSPEVASVGLSEQQAKVGGVVVSVGHFPFLASGKAAVLNEHRGLVKMVADGSHGQVLGVSIVGSHATELIAEAALAVKMEATVDDLVSTIHAHPTLSEAMGEAARTIRSRAIHL